MKLTFGLLLDSRHVCCGVDNYFFDHFIREITLGYIKPVGDQPHIRFRVPAPRDNLIDVRGKRIVDIVSGQLNPGHCTDRYLFFQPFYV